jgi:diguanylate cyclase (GGDEF)-like protein/PAS domain S-box-containing protein
MAYKNDSVSDLSENESRFRRLADSGIIGVFEGNESGAIMEGNDAFLHMLGYTREELEAGAIRWDRITAPGYEHVNRRFHEQLVASGAAAPAELQYFCRDGSRLPALVGLAALPSSGVSAIGFMLDQTEEKRAQEALRKSEEKFRQLAENIREVFWMMDLAGKEIVYVSQAYEQVWGQTCESLYNHPESRMNSIHPEDRKCAEERFHRQLAGEIFDNEYRIIQPSGPIRWIRDRAFPVRDAAGTVVRLAGVAEDITERKQSEFRLVHQALHDPLTDLPNRKLFRDNLKHAVASCDSGQSGAVFFLDLDQFKLVNDTLGHSAGDQLLQEVALRLLAIAGETGTLARVGGDEFMFVDTGFDSREAAGQLGLELIACLDAPFKIAGRELFIGASIGISLFPENDTDPDTLERESNVAMHEAKRAGKNQLRFFTPALAEAARERLELETRLRRALTLSEFRLKFQPQFAPFGTHPSRFEALIRWYPKGDRPVSPLKFIPIAEENGLIIPIGTWVLREACQQCADWQTGSLKGVGVAVNVSAPQFACPDFAAIVARTLESTGLPPHLLELELTESVFVHDVKASSATLTRLRNLGVTIALDDFGTGYSSLSYLQNLPIDALKIDRGFLIEAENRKQGAAVLRCVVELAHTLGLRVIGEGAETPAQLELLRSLGCDEIQGFLLGRPSFEVSSVGARWHIGPGAGYADSSECLARFSKVLLSSAPLHPVSRR